MVFVSIVLSRGARIDTMSLAQRVRDYRYSKGWGPDELANRAAISRTALYQIESGKTELPRAGTLRRIALALDVSMETLLGHIEGATTTAHTGHAHAAPSGSSMGRSSRVSSEWYPNEGAPLAILTQPRPVSRFDADSRFGHEYPAVAPNFENGLSGREREVMVKLHDLLASPFGEAISKIVEETYRLLPQTRVAGAYE
jgi:transcriptional regulator with XRE-family HTH domain